MNIKYFILAIALSASLIFGPPASAISLSYTANIGANGTICSTSGYISPSTDTRNQGDTLTVTFKNEQSTPLQIRNFPGGTFNVSGNAQVTRTATMESTFTYEAWLTDGTCQKASATITVNQMPAPAPESSTPSSQPPDSTPQPSTPQESPSDDPAAATQSTNTDSTSEPSTSGNNANEPSGQSLIFWLILLISLALLAILGLTVWYRQKRKVIQEAQPETAKSSGEHPAQDSDSDQQAK